MNNTFLFKENLPVRSGQMISLRMTPELRDLISRTARHINRTDSFVVIATARGVISGRPVKQRDTNETYHKSGEVVFHARATECEKAAAEQEDFRSILTLRCLEELEKPIRKKFTPPRGVIEGETYIIQKEDK